MFTGATTALCPPDSFFSTQVEGQTGKTASFADILQQSTAAAAGLQSAGINAGECVVLCCDKSILSYSLLLGVMFTGAITALCPPDSLFSTQVEGQTGMTASFADILSLTLSMVTSIPDADIIDKLSQGHTVKAVFCSSVYMDSVQKCVSRMSPPPLLGTVDIEDPVLKPILTSRGEFSLYRVNDVYKHTAVILFSSGTTGVPKGIEITDVAVQWSGINFDYPFKSFLVAFPFFWYSAIFTFVSACYNKYPLIMNNIPEVTENLRLTAKYQIQGWFLSTGSMSRYTNEPDLHKFDVSSVERVFVAGENILSCVAEDFCSKQVI
ncbi:mycosubtilin synthase subunit B-like [Homalodisca vitripennis]|uniref:mycosubtilin synthase subunit B-like n=1 Tax=Homalodisca vitripennis TaxID=197043 RepID=UPI001EEBB0D7|nr:mycosubtilin synthase subunit B-like [Homalodisca vitripennis]